jgi:hypothetical protein
MLAKEQSVTLDHIEAAHEKENAYLPLMSASRTDSRRRGNCEGKFWENSDGRRVRRHAANHLQVLDHLKIRHLFGAVVTSEMVKNQKPAPDIFLEAARRISVDPKFCRAYEDTDLGMQAIPFSRNGRGGCAGITASRRQKQFVADLNDNSQSNKNKK